ncbi:hypothetical protein B0H66DRAFT_537277 [Apodospora peruviana]|uniref:Nephrocystin 3-like N-terminal domain-containing protein n=1 Tax=Apodospora peruviana TaxID=516989 RepID=A0AAE0LZZ7_9PEZI|nr:hypothetical protein B0H66DRAFT_537277 [Apodospora peruviana]
MAEAIALTASVVADRVASICKFYIGKVDNYPKGLRLIYIEVGSLKVLFEGLSFLDLKNQQETAVLGALQGEDGPIQGCRRAVEELETLFPPVPLASSSNRRLKKEKLRMALAGLAWPLKAASAKRWLDEILQYKVTISLALIGQLLFGEAKAGDWIRGPVPQGTSSWHLHDVAKKLYEEETGDWVFQTPAWNNWVNDRNRAVWLHGVPGAGKTILASHVIE